MNPEDEPFDSHDFLSRLRRLEKNYLNPDMEDLARVKLELLFLFFIFKFLFSFKFNLI